MVNPFQIARLPRIFFRNKMSEELASLVKEVSSRIVVVSGNSFLKTGTAERFLTALPGYRLIKISGEPSPEVISNAVEECRSLKAGAVVGIGGGSVLDAGKAISAMLTVEERVEVFLEGVGTKEHPGTKVPYIAVPTTSGTGSEATKNAVISRTGPGGFKKSLRHDNFVPDIAVIDPLLTLTCPPELTAACGMDAFTQLTESFLSPKSGGFTDALALGAFRQVKVSLKRSFEDGSDAGARSGMSFAAFVSGICLANAGLGTIHGFASSVGGLYDIPHGVVCASLMARTNEMTVKKLRETSGKEALGKYAALGRIFIEKEGRSEDYYVDGFIGYLYELAEYFRIPRLGQYINESDIPFLSSITENKNNPVALDRDEMTGILTLSM